MVFLGSSSSTDLSVPLVISNVSGPECPKFDEGHCQCVKADLTSSMLIESPGNLSSATIQQLFSSSQPQLTYSTSSEENSGNGTRFNIACSFTKAEVIKDAFKKISGLNVSTLTLVHNVIPSLEDDFFKDLSYVEKILLKYNRITNISENAFRGNLERSLTHLFIDEFYWYSFHFKAFDNVPSKALINLKKLKEFTASSGYLTNISKSMLSSLPGLERLTLKGYKLAHIQNDAFADLNNLKSLEIKSSNLASLPTKALSRLSSLEELKIESRKIQTLNDSSFATLNNLKKLDLSSCSINIVSEDAFEGLGKSLVHLLLDRNSLKSVPRALNTLKSLEVLDLGFNDLNNLDSNSFIALSNLKNLTLDMNGLISISEESLRGLEYSLEYLSLMQNRLTHFPSKALNGMKKLKYLILSSNMIIEIPPEALSQPNEIIDEGSSKDIKINLPDKKDGKGAYSAPIKLRTLDLSRNRINKISGYAFGGSRDSLEVLNLAINKIIEYPVQFGEFSNLTYLDLSLNNIATLNIESLEGSQDRLEFLGVSGNSWRCDCNMAAFRVWLENWIKGLTLRDMYKMEKMIKETKCESPEELKGIPLHYPPVNHLICLDSNKKNHPGKYKNINSSRVPLYYFEDSGSLKSDNANNNNAAIGDNNNNMGSSSKVKNSKFLNNLESTRVIAMMGFLMSLLICFALLGFTLVSYFMKRSRKSIFSPSNHQNNSDNSDFPNMIMLSPSPDKNANAANKFAPSIKKGGLSFIHNNKWVNNNKGTKFQNEPDDDDKKIITKHEYGMPIDNLSFGGIN
ncbi:unnamed protein product [Gordionus sp. m RMFG-2023]